MPTERYIENNIIRNRGQIGYGDSSFIRRCRVGRGYGIADLLIFPDKGPHKVAVIEAKMGTSQDAMGKVIGQLILYYTGIRQVGHHGLRLMKQHSATKGKASRSLKPISLKMLSGGLTPPDAAWKELCKGKKLQPKEIELYVAIDGRPAESLKRSVDLLLDEHGLEIRIISVTELDHLDVYCPV